MDQAEVLGALLELGPGQVLLDIGAVPAGQGSISPGNMDLPSLVSIHQFQ